MRKGFVIGGLTLGALAAIGIFKLNSKAKAASDLKIAFGSLKVVGKPSIKDGVTFEVILKATNNSTVELKFTQPFVEISIADGKGGFSSIAQSTDAEGLTTLAARKVSPLRFNLNIGPAQAAKIPGLIMHFVNKAVATFTGATVASKKLLVEYGFTAEGLNFKEKTDVLV